MSFSVDRVFGCATVVELPKQSLRRYGVPPGGPFDRESSALANGLLGNHPGSPTFELLGGTAILTCRHSASLACVGAVGNLSLDGTAMKGNASFRVEKGQVLSVATGRDGNAVYLAELGGWGKGGVTRPLKVQDLRLADLPSSLRSGAFLYLPTEDFLDLKLPELRVHAHSNRAGVRLDGFAPGMQGEIASEPCCVGTIQLTPSGQLIVIGPDGPTIGGYPKIGYVLESDLDRLGQLRAGQDVVLQSIKESEMSDYRNAWLSVQLKRMAQIRAYVERT